MDAQQRNLLLAAGGFALGAALVIRATPRYSFAGRVVLITGGSRGLGLIMARQLIRQGARVAICARDADELERAVDQLQDHAGSGGGAPGGPPLRGGSSEPGRAADLLHIVCDVTREDDVQEMIDAIIDRWGRLDVLINNAGIIRMAPYDETTTEDFRQLVDTHLFGAIHTVAAALPHMRRQRGGRIVNISSIGGLVSVPHLLAYSASKHALTGFSRGLRAELARDNIPVTTVCPGVIRTGSPVRAQFKGRHRREQTWFALSASLPISSVSAERAAAQILGACRRGQPRLTISLAAKAASLTETVAPGAVSVLASGLMRILPSPGGIGKELREGYQSGTRLAPSPLTILTARAARRNNELPPGERWRRA